MKKFILFLLFACSNVFAMSGEGWFGMSQFGHQPDGIWYQNSLAHSLHMTSPTAGFGVTGNVADWVRWRAGYAYLGRVTSSAEATASDEDYATKRCNGKVCWPLSHWYGSGNVQGLYATLNPEHQVGSIKIIGEAGLWLYRPTWTMTIPDWRRCQDCRPEYLQVQHKPRWQPGLTLGIGLRYARTTLMLSRYTAEASGDEWPAVYHGGCTVLSIRQEF